MPTEGAVKLKGRVASLLEVGTGFHPEQTGRENIFLNGALLGFNSEEMQEKFDRIVDFSELWEFIDVPQRNYSSGMTARLGFSIASDIEPDILFRRSGRILSRRGHTADKGKNNTHRIARPQDLVFQSIGAGKRFRAQRTHREQGYRIGVGRFRAVCVVGVAVAHLLVSLNIANRSVFVGARRIPFPPVE